MNKIHIILISSLTVILLTVQSCSMLPFVGSPSRDFSRFIDDYYNGKYNALHNNNVQFWWLLADADSMSAVSSTQALLALYQIDTSRLSVDDRIDWLQLEAGIKRDIYDTVLHIAMKDPGRYLTLGNVSSTVSANKTITPKQWSSINATLQDAGKMIAIGRAQLHLPPPLWVKLAANTSKRYEGFLNGTLAARAAESAPDSLRTNISTAIQSTVAALAGYRNYINDTLQHGAENSWAVGREYYDWLLRENHFLPYTSESMIEAGLRIHNETKTQLEALCKRIDSTKTVRQLIADLKSHHPAPYKITEAYHRQSDRVKQLLIGKNLVDIPKPETLLFVPTPPSLRETYAWGGYGGIQEKEGVHEGSFFVTDIVPEMTQQQVDEKLRVQNNGWITVIALHEGYPGHHLQSLYALNNPRPVRKFSGNTYYVEGWALYAESWMARSGFYQNADDSLGWLQMRLWRTARVIIDPSIHTGKMTYEQAVQFMIDEVGLERSAAEAEVNRYTTWPTQAPSYIIGWLEIEDIKKEIQSKLGQAFDKKKFNEIVLGVGSLPLNLMKRAVRNAYGF